ncbi:MAG TPA: hypothetical protein VMS93_11785 [Candidatus Saccharimonadales bacterium]|nr:hypothetical protein [Candidatus Saccharimonadales bacterium]
MLFERSRGPAGLVALVLGAALLALALVRVAFLRPALPSAEEGRRLAERSGCFGCHGAEAGKGAPNLGAKDPVPSFTGGVLMMDTPQGAPQVRDWILLGTVGIERREAEEARQDSLRRARAGLPPAAESPPEHPALRMPAYARRFSAREVDRLVDFALAQGLWGADSAPAGVRHGLEVARRAGCFSCHGPLGLFARPDPGSVKGYIPAWRGLDAVELVRSPAEFGQWVRNGWPDRFVHQAIANWFLHHEAVRMPAFKDRLTDGEVAALDSLFLWVRAGHGGR